MNNLEIFVSSTCYDLKGIRDGIKTFIEGMGYNHVMSEYSEVNFDYKNHTHQNCIDSVKGVDMLILIIGNRFGGAVIPAIIEDIDLAEINKYSSKGITCKKHLSITHLEVITAIKNNIPIYTFISKDVLSNHLIYQKNKTNKDIVFPAFEHNPQDALPIFEFIDFLRCLKKNNAYESYEGIEDIKQFLLKQWSGLFKGLLENDRKVKIDKESIEENTEEDVEIKLKEAIVLEVKRILEDLSYRGVNNFSRNSNGFLAAREMVENREKIKYISSEMLFEIGYHMIDVSPNHNGIGIREGKEYFDWLFRQSARINLDLLAGMFFGSFFDKTNTYDVSLWPKYRYFPRILKYLFSYYENKDIIYVLSKVEENTQMGKSICYFNPMENEIIKQYVKGYTFQQRELSIVTLIDSILENVQIDIIVRLELDKFKLKIGCVEEIAQEQLK